MSIRTIKLLLTSFLFLSCFGTPQVFSQQSFQDPDAASLLAELDEQLKVRSSEIIKLYQNATPEERGSLPDINIEPYRELIPRYMDAANKFAKKQDAFPFLLRLVQAGRRLENGRSFDSEDPLIKHQRIALNEILEHHSRDARISSVIDAMIQSYHLSRDVYLDAIQRIDRDSTLPRVRAECQYAIAMKEPNPLTREQLFESVLRIDPESPVAEKAKINLFELRYLSIGSTPPNFVGESPDGSEIQLSDFHGKLVVLYFTSKNCGPCRAEIPATKARVKKYSDRPFVQLDIYTGPESKDDVSAYIKQHEVTWPVIHDQHLDDMPGWYGPIGNQWNVYGTPTVFVLDHNGVIISKNVRGKALEDVVQSTLESMS